MVKTERVSLVHHTGCAFSCVRVDCTTERGHPRVGRCLSLSSLVTVYVKENQTTESWTDLFRKKTLHRGREVGGRRKRRKEGGKEKGGKERGREGKGREGRWEGRNRGKDRGRESRREEKPNNLNLTFAGPWSCIFRNWSLKIWVRKKFVWFIL